MQRPNQKGHSHVVNSHSVAIPVSSATFSLVLIIVTFAISGCPLMKNRITATIVAFVVLVVVTTFVTVVSVACALMYQSFKITIAKPVNIRVVAPFA
jgi:hypothetical protein